MKPKLAPWYEEVIGAVLYAVALGVEAVARQAIHTGRRVVDRLRYRP